ncbi:MAG: hypothetical protein J3K34DRAFT_138376 [Monoraphidium minutum]|nr:MAG: hypothetical protein J3K34DRAFT_138376 [Monoraphidium minutum]
MGVPIHPRSAQVGHLDHRCAPRMRAPVAACALAAPPEHGWRMRHGILAAAAAGGGAAAGLGALASFQAVCQAATAACLLAVAVPPLLSTPAGTRFLCAAASRALPGDVRVKRIRADWVSPLSVEGLELLEGRGDGSRPLLVVGRITTAEPMYRLVFGGRVTLTVAEPAVDATLDDAGMTPRLLKHFRAARLLSVLSPAPHHQQQQPDGAGAAAAEVGETTDLAREGTASESGAGAPPEQKQAPLKAGASRREQQQHQQKQEQQAAAEGAPQEPTPADPLAAGAAAAGDDAASLAAGLARQPGGVSALRRRLSQADASSGFSLELRGPALSAVVSEGRLLVPREIREALGRHVHATVVVGAPEVRELAEEMGGDDAWVDAPEAPRRRQQQQQQQQQADVPGGEAAAGAAPGEGDQPRRGAAGDEADRIVDGAPVAIQVDSERLMLDARGWAVRGGGGADGGTLGGWRCVLQRPVQARVELTPEFAGMTLAEFNPLLGNVLSVRDGGRATLSFAPAGGALPCRAGALRLEPIRLAVGEGQLTSQVLRLLNLGGLLGGPGGGLGGLLFGGGGAKRQLEAWTGPMEVDIGADGRCSTRRVDMLLGDRVRVSVWGSVDTVTEAMRMRIGLPASTLALAGVRGLPPDYVLPLELHGGVRSPHLDWTSAVRKVAVLSAMQLGRTALGGGGGGGPAAAAAKLGEAPAPAAPVKPGGGGWGGGGGGGGAPLASMGGAMRQASQVFLQQCIMVDKQLQNELGSAAPPAPSGPAPWESGGGANA